MRLLLHLADHPGEVVSIEDLLTHVWAGVIVTSDSVYQAVAGLRRDLGDDSRKPTYIATVHRRGYRMVAAVGPWADPPPTPSAAPPPVPPARVVARAGGWRLGVGLAWGAVVLLSLGLTVVLRSNTTSRIDVRAPAAAVARVPPRSIAVLPFLDLTDAMDEEPFADGMTEELIDRLGRMPDLRVPAPRSSFYFKDKQLPVAVIAESLGVAFVLDGSVRKSGSRVRVAARLVRADNGYVAWSETYDRSFHDMLMVQDDIAEEVARALSGFDRVPTRSR